MSSPSIFAGAIGTAEGYGLPGAIPTTANNPGDLKLGDVGYGTTPGGITVYGSAEEGWQALEGQLSKITAGSSAYYSPQMSISQMGQLWAGGDPNWAKNVSSSLGADPSSPIGNYLPGGQNESGIPALPSNPADFSMGIPGISSKEQQQMTVPDLPASQDSGGSSIWARGAAGLVGLICIAGGVMMFKQTQTIIQMGTSAAKKAAALAAGLILAIVSSSAAWGQCATTPTTAIVTDPDGQAWVNGTWSATLYNPSGTQQPVCTNTGQAVSTSIQNQTLDVAGNLSFSFTDNNAITPLGTRWVITFCSNTSAPCNAAMNPILITGSSSQDLTVTISPQITAPRFSPGANARGYNDGEVLNPVQGSAYYNVTTNTTRQYNGTTWNNMASGSVANQASGVIPLGTSTNGIQAQSHLSDNGTQVMSGLPVIAPIHATCAPNSTAASCVSAASLSAMPAILPPGTTGTFNQYAVQQAFANCYVNPVSGQLTIFATQPGNGYSTAPTVTWANNGALPLGSLGTIVANAPVSGGITGYTITGTNSGWVTSTQGQCPITVTVGAPSIVTAAVVDVVNANFPGQTYSSRLRFESFGCVGDGVTDDTRCLINGLQKARDTGFPIEGRSGAKYHVHSVNGYFGSTGDDGSVPIAATLTVTSTAGVLSGCTVASGGSNLNTYPITQIASGGTGGTINVVTGSHAVTSCTASGGSGYVASFTAYAGNTCGGTVCTYLAPETPALIPINVTLPTGGNTLYVYWNGAQIVGDFVGSVTVPTSKSAFTLAAPYTACLGASNTHANTGSNSYVMYDLVENNCFIGLGGGGAQQIFVNPVWNSNALAYLGANAQYNTFDNPTVNFGWGGFYCGGQYLSRSPFWGNANGSANTEQVECDAFYFDNARIGLGGTNAASIAQFNLNRQALDCYIDTYWRHFEDFGLTNSDACYTPPAGFTTTWGTTARVTDQDLASMTILDNMWRGAAGIGLDLNAYNRQIGGPYINGFTVKNGFSYAIVLGPYESPTVMNQISDEGQYANAFQGNQGLFGSTNYPNPYEPYANGPRGIVFASQPGNYNLVAGSIAADAVVFPIQTSIHSPNKPLLLVNAPGAQGVSLGQRNVAISTPINTAGVPCLWCDNNTGSRYYQYAQGGNGVTIPMDSSIGQFCGNDWNTFTQFGTRCWTLQQKANQMPGTATTLQFSYDNNIYDALNTSDYPAYVRMPYVEISSGPRLNGAVNGFAITNAGSGYNPGYVSCSIAASTTNIQGTSTPYQAECAAWANTAGVISDISCGAKCGIGYTVAPAVIIAAPGAGIQATATATVNAIGNHKQVGHWIFATTYLAASGTVPAYGTTTLAGVTCQDAIFGPGNNTGKTDMARVVAWGTTAGDALIKTAYVTAANTCTIVLTNPTGAGIAYGAGSTNQPWIIELISVNQTVSGAITSSNTATNTNNGIMTASLVTTAAASDNVTLTGMTSAGHCSLQATNAAAGTNITTTFVSAKTTNQITVTHTATAAMNYDVLCVNN